MSVSYSCNGSSTKNNELGMRVMQRAAGAASQGATAGGSEPKTSAASPAASAESVDTRIRATSTHMPRWRLSAIHSIQRYGDRTILG